ncbi:hypothetical protein D3C81_1373250 [compost metagenome]
MFFLSARGMFSSVIISECLSMFKDSPVSELSLTCSEKFSITLPSAAIKSPASRRTISPGKTSLDGISIFTPFLITLEFGAERAFKLFSEASAFTCWIVPSKALTISTIRITMVLSLFPTAKDTIEAASNTPTIKSLNCSRKITIRLFLSLSISSLKPCLFLNESKELESSPSLDVLNSLNNSLLVLLK